MGSSQPESSVCSCYANPRTGIRTAKSDMLIFCKSSFSSLLEGEISTPGFNQPVQVPACMFIVEKLITSDFIFGHYK